MQVNNQKRIKEGEKTDMSIENYIAFTVKNKGENVQLERTTCCMLSRTNQ